MQGWTIFWGALLVVTLVFYAVLVIYVTIGGFNDIKQMFRRLGEDDQDREKEESDL